MRETQEQSVLFRYLGSHSPYWRLTADSNALHFAPEEHADTTQVVALTDEQAAQIRAMTVITSSLTMRITLFGEEVTVHWSGAKLHVTPGQAARRRGTIPRLSPEIWCRVSPLPSKWCRKPTR